MTVKVVHGVVVAIVVRLLKLIVPGGSSVGVEVKFKPGGNIVGEKVELRLMLVVIAEEIGMEDNGKFREMLELVGSDEGTAIEGVPGGNTVVTEMDGVPKVGSGEETVVGTSVGVSMVRERVVPEGTSVGTETLDGNGSGSVAVTVVE